MDMEYRKQILPKYFNHSSQQNQLDKAQDWVFR